MLKFQQIIAIVAICLTPSLVSADMFNVTSTKVLLNSRPLEQSHPLARQFARNIRAYGIVASQTDEHLRFELHVSNPECKSQHPFQGDECPVDTSLESTVVQITGYLGTKLVFEQVDFVAGNVIPSLFKDGTVVPSLRKTIGGLLFKVFSTGDFEDLPQPETPYICTPERVETPYFP